MSGRPRPHWAPGGVPARAAAAREGEAKVLGEERSLRAEVKRRLAGRPTSYVIYIMSDTTLAERQNREQLDESERSLRVARDTIAEVETRLGSVRNQLEAAELEFEELERMRKQWMCEACLSAHTVLADDDLATMACQTCGLPRHVSDLQREERENFRQELALAVEARTLVSGFNGGETPCHVKNLADPARGAPGAGSRERPPGRRTPGT